MSTNENLTRPFIVSTDIKMIDTDDTLSSSSTTINSTKTGSSSSIESTTIAHRFISKKIFKPETCFVVNTFYSLSIQ